jgi:hypothetical protein
MTTPSPVTTPSPAAKHNIPAPQGFFWAGGLMLAAAIAIDSISFQISALGVSQSGTVPQWNDLCTSGIGQFGQGFSRSAHTDCGYVAAADHAIGWLVGLGIASVVIAVVALVARSRTVQQHK